MESYKTRAVLDIEQRIMREEAAHLLKRKEQFLSMSKPKPGATATKEEILSFWGPKTKTSAPLFELD